MNDTQKKPAASLLSALGLMLIAFAVVIGDGWVVSFAWARLVRPWIEHDLPLSKAICLTMFALVAKAVASGRPKDTSKVTFERVLAHAIAMYAVVPLIILAISAIFAP